MKATANVTGVFGNGSAQPFAAAPTLAELKPRFKNEYATPMATMLATAGFVRATGPTAIDWDNITFDPSIGIGQAPVTVGHDYYRFDDTDQAGHPVFLVIRHRIARVGSAATATAYMMFPDIIICHGIDSSGNPLQIARTVTTYPSRGSGDNGYHVAADQAFPMAATTQPGFMSLRGYPTTASPILDPAVPLAFHVLVERLRDATGAPQSADRGVIYYTASYQGSNSLTQVVGISSLDTTSVSAAAANYPCTAPTLMLAGTVSPIYPVAYLAPRPRSSRNWAAGASGDWPTGSEATIPVPGGGSGNFKSVGSRMGTNMTSGASAVLLVRWE